MRIIKNARIYSCPTIEMPTVDMLEPYLFQPPASSQLSSRGWVSNDKTGELVTELACGWSLRYRIDEKVIPAGAVNLSQTDFHLGPYMRLENPLGNQRVTIQAKTADDFSPEKAEDSLRMGYRITAVALGGNGCSFRLTDDLVFRSIVFDEQPDEDLELDTAEQVWLHEATTQLMTLHFQVEQLLQLTGSILGDPQEGG